MNLIISSCLLYYPKNEITFKNIKIITRNIFIHIKNKKYKTYLNGPPQNFDIEQAALNLGFTINGQPNDKTKGDQALVNLDEKKNKLVMVSLEYYGNQLG